MLASFLQNRVIVKVADITVEEVDAIVNAANSSLLGGGGVDGAIHRKGGPAILDECREIRRKQYPSGLPTGEAVITTAGGLPAKYVIHTVGPVYGQDRPEDQYLAAAYRNSLARAVENDLASVAFPAISTGVYGYPKDEAATVASLAIGEFLETHSTIAEVRLVFFHDSDAEIFLANHVF
ncbi:MAG: O-acetyl-ADP-ribose deacetylase [Pyrinomonadaceae bacterium]